MIMRLGITFFIILGFLSAAYSQDDPAQHDNRIKPGFKVGDVIPGGDELLDESMLFDKIASFQNGDLSKALGRDVLGEIWR
jgi:hypothetical protein